MMQYTKKTTEIGGEYIEAIDGDKIMQIPIDPANFDYQAYLNKDKAALSTPIVNAD